MVQNIEGKVVVITGASSGLGEAAARALIKAGAKVVVGARRLDKLQALVKEAGLPEESAVKVDVTKLADVKNLIDVAVKLHGRVDVLINNAGYMPLSPLEAGLVQQWDDMIDINIKGVLYGINAVLPQMIKQKSGQIINTSSVAALKTFGSGAVYCATKSAVKALSEGLRQEVKPHNLRTTSIYPGAVESELTQHITDESTKGILGSYGIVPIPASSFADMVMFAISQPENVDVNEIVFRPTSQEL